MNESSYCVTLLDDFKHPCVRDLAWVIVSPPLVSGRHKQTLWWSQRQCLDEFNDCLAALRTLDKKPQALLEHLNLIKSKRLGLYFENLVSFWLSSISPNYRLLAKNIQLFKTHKKGKHTLGELDFIMQHRSSHKTIHLEVAVKFYLGTTPLENTYHWFGTNTKDQLGKKLDHLKLQQTQLSNKYPELMDFKIDEQHCFIKGRLFYPTRQSKHLQIPDGICKNHLRGRWISSSEKNKKQQLITLEKRDWLAELDHDAITRHLHYQHDNKPDKATCFALVEKDKNASYKEVERLFVLPNDFTFPTKSPET